MNDALFDWDDANIFHIAAHDVVPEEAEEILLGDAMELDFDVENGEERWTYVGETGTSRFLTVVFTVRNERMRVITAFVASPLRKQIFLQWKAQQL